MIAIERERICNPLVTSHATTIKLCVKKLIDIDNTFGYDHINKTYVMH